MLLSFWMTRRLSRQTMLLLNGLCRLSCLQKRSISWKCTSKIHHRMMIRSSGASRDYHLLMVIHGRLLINMGGIGLQVWSLWEYGNNHTFSMVPKPELTMSGSEIRNYHQSQQLLTLLLLLNHILIWLSLTKSKCWSMIVKWPLSKWNKKLDTKMS